MNHHFDASMPYEHKANHLNINCTRAAQSCYLAKVLHHTLGFTPEEIMYSVQLPALMVFDLLFDRAHEIAESAFKKLLLLYCAASKGRVMPKRFKSK